MAVRYQWPKRSQSAAVLSSSFMGNDVPYEIDTPEGPLTEVPVQSILDDAPLFRHVYGAGNVFVRIQKKSSVSRRRCPYLVAISAARDVVPLPEAPTMWMRLIMR